jgi:hypothetical protein
LLAIAIGGGLLWALGGLVLRLGRFSNRSHDSVRRRSNL